MSHYDEINRLERQLDRLRVRKNRYYALLMAPVQDNDGFYSQDLIPGLCPAQCSCGQCRAARMACPKYQAHLNQSRALQIAGNWGVESHLHSSASCTGGDVKGILTRWVAKATASLDKYHADFLVPKKS